LGDAKPGCNLYDSRGQLKGGSSWSSDWIEPATPEKLEKVSKMMEEKRANDEFQKYLGICNNFYHISGKFSVEDLTTILPLMKELTDKLVK